MNTCAEPGPLALLVGTLSSTTTLESHLAVSSKTRHKVITQHSNSVPKNLPMKNKNTSAQRHACKYPQQPYSQQTDTGNNPSNNQLMNDKQDVVGQQSVAQHGGTPKTLWVKEAKHRPQTPVSFL